MSPSVKFKKDHRTLLEKLHQDVSITFADAQRFLRIYEDAKKDVSGNPECRRIGRMKIVLEMFLAEVLSAVEAAEKESV